MIGVSNEGLAVTSGGNESYFFRSGKAEEREEALGRVKSHRVSRYVKNMRRMTENLIPGALSNQQKDVVVGTSPAIFTQTQNNPVLRNEPAIVANNGFKADPRWRLKKSDFPSARGSAYIPKTGGSTAYSSQINSDDSDFSRQPVYQARNGEAGKKFKLYEWERSSASRIVDVKNIKLAVDLGDTWDVESIVRLTKRATAHVDFKTRDAQAVRRNRLVKNQGQEAFLNEADGIQNIEHDLDYVEGVQVIEQDFDY